MIDYSEPFKELMDYLVQQEYAVWIDNKPVLTKKFYDIFPPPNTEMFIYQRKPNVILESSKKRVYSAEEKKQIWNEFVDRAEIPFRVKAPGGGIYTVKHYSKPAVDKLISILETKDLDYTKFIESTKNYYKTVTYKLTLQRYLCEEVWEEEYKQWGSKAKQVQTTNDGSSRWEN